RWAATTPHFFRFLGWGFAPLQKQDARPATGVFLIRWQRPAGLRPRLELAVDVDRLHALVEEAHQAGDLRAFGNWTGVAPHEVLPHLVSRLHRPVRRQSLVRTAAAGIGRLQEI